MLPALMHTEANVPYLMVDGKPFPMLGGELHNSASSDLFHMEKNVWPALRNLNMNTVIAAMYWESIEPEDGVFDFTLLEGLLQQARQEDMRIVLLWFGLWKNGESFYIPQWVKLDRETYFRAQLPYGRQTDTISPLCLAAVERDKQAFIQLMTYLHDHDAQHTVVMVQVENEIGLMGAERDYSPVAQEAFKQPVPEEVKALYGWDGTWADHPESGEMFMAWHYARAVDAIASAGKAILPLPMYVNCWLEQHPDRAGIYPSGGPVAKLIPLWQKGAPMLDLIAPDIYVMDFKSECEKYNMYGNPLFIPEAARNAGSVSRVLYAFGQHHALGFSPFAIEDMQGQAVDEMSAEALAVLHIDATAFDSEKTAVGLRRVYGMLKEIYPRLVNGETYGFLQRNPYDKGCTLSMEKYDVQIDYLEGGSCGSGGLILMDEDGFYIIGCNVRFSVLPKIGSGEIAEVLRLDEGEFKDGAWQQQRIMNGDERYAALRLDDTPRCHHAKVHIVQAKR